MSLCPCRTNLPDFIITPDKQLSLRPRHVRGQRPEFNQDSLLITDSRLRGCRFCCCAAGPLFFSIIAHVCWHKPPDSNLLLSPPQHRQHQTPPPPLLNLSSTHSPPPALTTATPSSLAPLLAPSMDFRWFRTQLPARSPAVGSVNASQTRCAEINALHALTSRRPRCSLF